MTMLPEHLINKIMLYVSHPIADMYLEDQEERDFFINFNSNVWPAFKTFPTSSKTPFLAFWQHSSERESK